MATETNIPEDTRSHSFTVEAATSEKIPSILQHWQNTWKAVGYSNEHFAKDWQHQTLYFLKSAGTSGLRPKTFVAHSNEGNILGSVHSQIWAGPIPWVVRTEVFRLGTLWGLYIEETAVQNPELANTIRQELLQATLEHLQEAQCSKVVTLAPTLSEREAMVQARIGFQQANMLTLDLLANNNWVEVPSDQHTKKRVGVGPVGAEHDTTVCSHWRLMWQDVGIPKQALLPDMEQVTGDFLKQARERLHYQTFAARCPTTRRVVGSVSCQIWEGPFPKIVGPDAFQLGTIWAVYVDPAYRRQGVATALMKLALQHLKDVQCHTAILIAASEGGQCVYERLGFRANNALVCDLQQPTNPGSDNAVAEEKKQDDGETSNKVNIILDLRQSLDGLSDVSFSELQVKTLCTATTRQLAAVYSDLPQGNDIVEAVTSVQKKHGVFIDPEDNWFTQNLVKFGRGFNMKRLQDDPSILASKFDRLANRYDHWTVGNRSKVESFIVRCVRETSRVLPGAGRGTRVLDVACGIGLQGQILRLCGFQGRIVGTDISAGMVKRVIERGCYDYAYVSDANQTLSCCHDDVDTPPPYDVVICTGALELLDQAKALQNISNETKSGGEIWVSFQLDTTDKQMQNSTQHQNVRGITREDALNLLQDAGFGDIVSVDTCPNAFYTPSPAQDGSLLPVPYLFIVAKKKD